MKNKNSIQKNLISNDNGIGALNSLLLIIVIAVLIWQFIFPLLGLGSMLDYYSDYQEQKAENLTYSFDLVDTVTQSRIIPDSTKSFDHADSDYNGAILYYVLDKSDSHSIKLTTNIPYSITNPYYVRFISKEIKQIEHVLPTEWEMEFIGSDNVVYESSGKLTSNDYIYNMGSEIRLNDGVLYIYGNIYEIVVLSPNNQILYQFFFLIRMDN